MDADIRRAELAERDGLLESFAAAPDEVATALGLAHGRINGMGVIASNAVPVIDFNRVVAVGVEAPASAGDLSAALAWLDRHGAGGWGFQIGPQAMTPEVAAWLATRGLAPAGNGWAKLVLALDDAAPPARADDDITVRRVTASTAELFGRVMQTGFGAPPATTAWFAALGALPTWHAYLAYVGNEPAGVGSLFMKDGTAWLNSAATLSDHRGRGVQTALIARRLADARAMGIELATAETGYPADDENAFPSCRNYLRAGFGLAYVRPNYQPS